MPTIKGDIIVYNGCSDCKCCKKDKKINVKTT